ncbi:MAG TPA: NADH-quinone oxidoreductase subunit H [Polyangiaceae bacterium]|nr:NADH-quinone oxidoreductase subunit H [Polyangiaceae bacterium]
MKWLRALAPVAAAFVLVWLIAGIQARAERPAPGLLQVLEMTPGAVEPGDSIALLGEGFPPGKPARVVFRGVLRRPGQRPVPDAEVVLSGSASSDERVEIPFNDAAATLFAGAPGGPLHTTFEGDVEVAFAAAAPGASPVAGVLSGVTLDVNPAEGAGRAERDREGECLLSFLGIRPAAAESTSAGLRVEVVAPGSRAAAAGLSVGDAIVAFDGVRVASAGDVLPAPGERDALAVVRRKGSEGEVARTVSVEGFRRASLANVVESALVVLSALVAVLLLAAPLGRTASASVQRGILRLRRRLGGAGSRRPGRAALSRLLAAVAARVLPPSGVGAVADASAYALLLALPFGQYLVAARLDVGVLFVGAATALVVAALVSSESPWAGLRAALSVALQHVPAAAAVAGVVVGTGSLRVQEIEHGQGGWPWEWLAFGHPGALVALGLLLACATIEPSPARARSRGLAGLIDAADASPLGEGGSWGLRTACRVQRVVICGLACILFLGGWLLPGLSPAQQDAHASLQVAGAAWLLAKTWGVAFLVEGMTWSVLPAGGSARSAALWLMPLSMASFAASVAWTWCSPSPTAQLLVSASLLALTCAAGASSFLWARHGLLVRSADARACEFL